jgi:hypothetical protein
MASGLGNTYSARMRPPRLLAGAVAGLLIAAGLVGVGTAAPAAAAADYPTIEHVEFSPVTTIFDSPSETLTATVEMDAPGDWPFVSAKLRLTDAGGNALPDWLKLVDAQRIGQRHILTFRGDVPDGYRYVALAYPDVFYRDTTGALREVTSSTYSATQYFYGDTKLSIDGPSRITPGESLRFTGRATCYRNGQYVSAYEPAHGGPYVYLEYRDPDTGVWTYANPIGSSQVNSDGTWALRILSVGATLDWRVSTGGTRICASATSRVLHVEAGNGEPPPAPDLPGAPGLQLGEVTQTTAALGWSPAEGQGILGYRFGWEADGGKPQPAWSQSYTLAQLAGNNPFVMTNLCAGCSYTMWVQAMNAVGEGPRTTVRVTTKAADAPPPPPVVTDPNPPPATTQPSVPQSVRAVPGARGSGQITLHWDIPAEGDVVDRYQVKRSGNPAITTLRSTERSYVFGKLAPSTAYTLSVRAHGESGYGPWADVDAASPAALPPPPPSAHRPGKVRSLHASPRVRSAVITWRAPRSNGGSRITRYFLKSRGYENHAVSGSTRRVRVAITDGKTHVVYIRAKNARGYGPWARVVARAKQATHSSPPSNPGTPNPPPSNPGNPPPADPPKPPPSNPPPPPAKDYANCDDMHADYPHGVGRPGAVDKTSGTRVTNFFVSQALYNANSESDRDGDGIACEA